jgi:hypothetical protein
VGLGATQHTTPLSHLVFLSSLLLASASHSRNDKSLSGLSVANIYQRLAVLADLRSTIPIECPLPIEYTVYSETLNTHIYVAYP